MEIAEQLYEFSTNDTLRPNETFHLHSTAPMFKSCPNTQLSGGKVPVSLKQKYKHGFVVWSELLLIYMKELQKQHCHKSTPK